jgi:hypothetical protein
VGERGTEEVSLWTLEGKMLLAGVLLGFCFGFAAGMRWGE